MEVPSYGMYENQDWDEPQKGHAAMITRMDHGIGLIMQKLKELGLDDNTIVMFSSDNGPHQEGGADPSFFDSNGPLKGKKRDLYEGGIRVPLIVRWNEKIKADTTNEHISAFWDILPTIQELVKDNKTVKTDGISFLPVLLGNLQKAHEYLYWEFHEQGGKQAVRMGNWKGVRLWETGDEIELYDIKEDPGETKNIANERSGIVSQIAQIMKNEHTNNEMWTFPL